MSKIAEDKSAEDKIADIEKEIEAPAEEAEAEDVVRVFKSKDYQDKIVKPLEDDEPRISNKTLDSLCEHPLNRILSSLSLGGIVLKKPEFQRIIIIKMGKPPGTDEITEKNLSFPWNDIDFSDIPGSHGGYDFEPDLSIMRKMIPHMEDRSYLTPVLKRRIIRVSIQKMPKRAFMSPIDAAFSPSFPPLLLISLLYAMYRSKFAPATMGNARGIVAQAERWISTNPQTAAPLLALLGSAGIETGKNFITPNPGGMRKRSAIEFLPHILGPYAGIHIGSAYLDALSKNQERMYGDSSVPDILKSPNKLFGIYAAGMLGKELGAGRSLIDLAKKMRPV